MCTKLKLKCCGPGFNSRRVHQGNQMTKRKGQNDIVRRQRLNEGNCPTHGIPLVQIGVDWEEGKPVGDVVACPRGDCTFRTVPKKGTKLYDALRDMEARMFST